MSPEIIAVVSLLAFLVLVAAEVPIGLAIGAAGVLGIVLQKDLATAAFTLEATPYSSSAKYALVVVPMYALLGTLVSQAGIGHLIYSAVNRAVGRLAGGLSAAAVLATATFSGISGSSAADIAAFGRISVNEMSRRGYRPEYSAAVVAAAGTFAVLIPPSLTIVIYAILAEENIGTMILAGVVPGILSALILCLYVILRARFRPKTVYVTSATESVRARSVTAPNAGSGPGGTTAAAPVAPVSSLRADLIGMAYAAVLFAIVVGGLYSGIFTVTESAGLGAFAALIIAVLARRNSEHTLLRMLWLALVEAVQSTSMIFLIFFGGAVFAFSLVLTGVPSDITRWVSTLEMPPLLIIALLLLILIPIGAVLDGLSALLITVPILAPVATGLGYDGIWFGILVIKMVEIGLITPPVGVNAFIISGITRIPSERIFYALAPFVVLDLAVTSIFFVFPETILWLPRTAGVL